MSASCPGSKPPHSAARTDEHVFTPQRGRLHLLGPLFFLLLLVSNVGKVRLPATWEEGPDGQSKGQEKSNTEQGSCFEERVEGASPWVRDHLARPRGSRSGWRGGPAQSVLPGVASPPQPPSLRGLREERGTPHFSAVFRRHAQDRPEVRKPPYLLS